MGAKLKVRELYAPSHFGNTFEVELRPGMIERLTEAKEWGFNVYSDWFDTVDLLDIYARPSGHFNLPEAMWARKFESFAEAAALGFELGLGITPNHVFLDQVTPNTAAVLDKGIFGQLVCPSKPGVTEMVLDFYRHLFQDFSDRGLSLKRLSFGAYDYGGCACDNCRPWILTFAKLARRIAALGREFFGDMEIAVAGWLFTDEDYKSFADWADREAPEFCGAMVFQAPLGPVSDDGWLKRMPRRAKARAFIHTPNGERQCHDIYGHYGPTLAPRRMEKTVATLFQRGAEGFTAYSEGDMDEINRAVVAGIGSGGFDSADEVLKAYAAKHLGGDLSGWAEWLCLMGDILSVDARDARTRFDHLALNARKTWRLEALAKKLEMLEADRAAAAAAPGSVERHRAEQAFWNAKAYLWREVWKMGMGRSIFKFHINWAVPDWAKTTGGQKTAVGMTE